MSDIHPSESTVVREVREKVLGRIERGNIRMRSRLFFIVRVVLLVALALLTLGLSSLVLSFILFSIHESGEQFLLGFGGRGLQTFVDLFPWIPLVVDIALILLLQAAIQRFKIGYRVPLAVLFGAAFVGSIAIGFFVTLTPLHPFLLDRADRGELPIIGDLYEGIHGPHEDRGVFHGTVTAVASGTITICDSDRDADDATRTVSLPPGFHAPLPHVGDQLFIFGTTTNGHVEAYGFECENCGGQLK